MCHVSICLNLGITIKVYFRGVPTSKKDNDLPKSDHE